MFCRDYSQAWCIKKQKHQHQDGNPQLPTTPAPATTSAANMKTRSQGEAESTSMDDFIINRLRKLSAATTKK